MLKHLGRSISIFAIYFEVNPKKVKWFNGWIEEWKGFPGGSDDTESAYNVGDLGSIPGSGWQGNPLQYSCLGNPHGQRSLVGYSPWYHKELDMTEQLSTAQ